MPVRKHFGDYSFSLGLVWTPSVQHMVKVNIGRSFRLPGANELAANGVHHGTFRHEQGDASLKSEQGWQMDASYQPASITDFPFPCLLLSVGSVTTSFCVPQASGLFCRMPDRFTATREPKHCLPERKLR